MLNTETKKKVMMILKQLENIPNVTISEVEVDLEHPPCSKCKHFRPHVEVSKKDGKYKIGNKRLCCLEGSLYSDFSCFEGK